MSHPHLQTSSSPSDTFRRDINWNLASFAIVAITGVLANILIARFFGPDALGAFNQALALYIVFSQVSTCGIHLAVLRYVSRVAGDTSDTPDQERIRSIVSVAMISVSIVALAITALCYALSGLVARIFDSQDVLHSWLYILPGLWFFSLNKVLIAVVNGLRHMRMFAVAQAARYLLMAGLLLAFGLLAVESAKLTLVVTFSEILLFIVLAIYVHRLYPVSFRSFNRETARTQLLFGLRGMWGNALTELNTRVDVIILGLFMTDHVVGIYSMVAMIFEGLFQCVIVLRNVFNPRIALLLAAGRTEEFSAEFRRMAKIAYIIVLAMAMAAVALYSPFVNFVLGDPSFYEGYWSLVILMVGLWIASGWLSLDMLLVQAGDPTGQSLLKALTVGANAVVTVATVPIFGMVGAAAGCAISIVLSIGWLKVLARRRLGLHVTLIPAPRR